MNKNTRDGVELIGKERKMEVIVKYVEINTYKLTKNVEGFFSRDKNGKLVGYGEELDSPEYMIAPKSKDFLLGEMSLEMDDQNFEDLYNDTEAISKRLRETFLSESARDMLNTECDIDEWRKNDLVRSAREDITKHLRFEEKMKKL